MRFFVLLSVTDWPNEWYACAWGKREKTWTFWWSVSGGWKWIGLNLLVSFQNLKLIPHFSTPSRSLPFSYLFCLSFFLRIPSHQLFLLASTCLPFHFILNFPLTFHLFWLNAVRMSERMYERESVCVCVYVCMYSWCVLYVSEWDVVGQLICLERCEKMRRKTCLIDERE